MFQREPGSGPASLDEVPSASGRPGSPGGSPFQRPGLLARVGPFAMVALIAEASLALPPGTHVGAAVAVSLVLLAVTALAILLPWDRLPAWMPVLVPLAYTGSVLALTLAAGSVSGVGIVVLIPLIWTALFHRRWESACVVAAIVAVQIAVSVLQSAPGAVTARRALLWGALGSLLAVAAHGLRDRIGRSQLATAELQQRLTELEVIKDRDRLAADLQGSVVQRIFAAGLKLQGVLSLATGAEVRRRVESSVTDLDDAIRLIRQAIFGLQNRLETPGLRQQVLQLCAGLSPVPEIRFAGPVDGALLPEASDQLLGMLRTALGVVGAHAGQTSVDVWAGETLTVVVTGTGAGPGSADGDGAGPGSADGDGAGRDLSPPDGRDLSPPDGRDLSPPDGRDLSPPDGRDLSGLHERAGRAGTTVQIEPVPGGTRLAWSLPLRPGLPGSGPLRGSLGPAEPLRQGRKSFDLASGVPGRPRRARATLKSQE